MERLFPFRRGQSVFRRGWGTDLTHFFISHLLVQLLTYLTLLPSTVLFAWLVGPSLQTAVQSQPVWLQFGTKHLPEGRWPARYGVVGYTLPEGWWPQLLWPFRKVQTPVSQQPTAWREDAGPA